MQFYDIPFFNSLFGRLLAALALTVLISVGGLGLAAYVDERAALRNQVTAQLTSIADLKKEQIVDWLYARRADARLLAVNKLNQDHLTAILSPNVSPERKAEFRDFLTDNLIGIQESRTGYTEIAFVDTTGTVIVATDPALVDQPTMHPELFEQTLAAPDGAYIQDIHHDPNTGQNVMALGHVMHAIDLETGRELPEIIGITHIIVDMETTIYPLIEAWPGMGETGETLLIRAEGDDTLFLNDLRFDPDAALALRLPATSADAKPAHYASRGQEGIIETTDYRGAPVLAAYRHIPGIQWGFVAKQDLEQAFAPVNQLATRLVGLALIVLVAGLGISAVFSRSLTQPLDKLVEATQAVAQGNLKTKIDVDSEDELGALAQSFRSMINALEQRQRELRKANEATQRSARQLKITRDFLHQLNAVPDIALTFPAIIDKLRGVLNFETAALATLDQNRQNFTITAMDNPRIVPLQGLTLPLSETAAAENLTAGRPHLTPHLVKELSYPMEKRLYEAGYRSRVTLPLRVEDRTIGMLTMSWTQPAGYDETQLSLLEQIADGIALAFERSRLFDETRRHSVELAALQELSLRVNSSLDRSEVLQLAVEQTAQLLEASGATIFLLNEENKLRLGASQTPDWSLTDAEQVTIANYLWDHYFTVCGDEMPLVSVDKISSNPDDPVVGKLEEAGVQAVKLTQLSQNEKCQGLLMVFCPRVEPMGHENQLANTIAQIIGPAIAHAQSYYLTYEQLQETNERLQLVNQTSRQLTAILDREQLLNEVVTLVRNSLGYNHVGVGLVEEDQIVYRAMAVGVEMEPAPFYIDLEGNSISAWTARRGQTLRVPDVSQDTRYQPHPKLSSIKSEIAVPIQLGGNVLGVLLVASDRLDAFTEADQMLLRAIADQLALALQNAQSYSALREQIDKVVRESEERLRSIYNAANDAIFLIDPVEACIVETNPTASEMLGYSQEQLTGMAVEQIHPQEMDTMKMIWQDILERGNNQNHQLTCLTQAEEVIPAEISFSRVQIKERQYILAMVRDIAERKSLEEQLRQAQKMEAIGQLAGGVAHDFNNLLTVITGYSDLLGFKLKSLDDESLQEDLEQIKGAGERASALTRQLLAFSRRQVIQPKIININDVVTETQKMLRRLIGENIEMNVILEPELRPVKCDPGQVDQVILNLAVNARDAMPEGGKLTIETANVTLNESYASQHVGLEPGPYIMLAITDTGVGMDDETRSRIFEPFFTTKPAGKGTGLGLATVYGIVTQSDGAIHVYSEPGHGTTFKVYLPQVKSSKTPSNGKQKAEEQFPTGSETILVVEDEYGVRNLAHDILQRQGYQVLIAGDGQEALSLSKEHSGSIHLVLTDVVMPHMGGRELAEQLRQVHPESKVLYMSGYADKAAVQHEILSPEVKFLQKPFTPESLSQKVRQTLDEDDETEAG